MKKIYALIAGLAIAGAVNAQRQLDMSLTLATPVNGSSVPQETAQTIDYTIKMKGGALVDGDSVFLYYYNLTKGTGYSMTGVLNQMSYVPANSQTLAILNGASGVNSSMIGGTPLTLNTAQAGFDIGDTIFVVSELGLINTNPGSDTLGTNDMGWFKLRASGVGLVELNNVQVSAYPNPATNLLTIVAEEEIATVRVIALNGGEVVRTKGNVVNVENLPAGVYLYAVTTVSGARSINKFVKK